GIAGITARLTGLGEQREDRGVAVGSRVVVIGPVVGGDGCQEPLSRAVVQPVQVITHVRPSPLRRVPRALPGCLCDRAASLSANSPARSVSTSVPSARTA